MNVRQNLVFALRGIGANRLRSGLTTLGILIGVAAVIVLVAVGTGSSQAVAAQINRLGSNVVTVTPSQGGTGGRAGGFFGAFGRGNRVNTGTQTRTAQLTLADAAALVDPAAAPDILDVAPVMTAGSVTATYEGATHSVGSFVGTSPGYLAIDNDSVQAGVAFTDTDYTSRRRVALLGTDVSKDLVGGDGFSAVGKTVQFNGAPYVVVGILTDKGTTGPISQDDRVIAPLTAVQDTLTGYGTLSSISVKARSASAVANAEAEVADILNGRHHVTSATADYTIRSSSSILTAATSSNHTFTVLLASVAAISLLVGGIGVMNIMLVTVTERTREIGIRKAIGARKSDIVGQFLLEAVLLSVLGGAAGVAAGVLGSRFRIVGVQPSVAPYSVALAFGVAVAVGLVFGLYPAQRAASLRPIDALRYE